MIGWLLGAAITYSTLKGISNVAEDYSKKADRGLDRKAFDQQNMINGIGQFNEQKINQIAARCGVRPNDYGVLPLFGYEQCIDYVKEYVNDPTEIDDFTQAWMLIVKIQEDRQKGRVHDQYSERYHKLVNHYKNDCRFSDTDTTVFSVNHWYDIPISEHKERCKEIYDETYLGRLAVTYPVIRGSQKVYGSRTETWQVKTLIEDLPHSDWLIDKTWKGFYNTCCKYLGYKP